MSDMVIMHHVIHERQMANMHFLYPHMHHMHESIYKRRDEKRRGVRLFLVIKLRRRKIRYRIDRVTCFLNLKIKFNLSLFGDINLSQFEVERLISISLSIYLKPFLAKACANFKSFRSRTPAVPPCDLRLVTDLHDNVVKIQCDIQMPCSRCLLQSVEVFFQLENHMWMFARFKVGWLHHINFLL